MGDLTYALMLNIIWHHCPSKFGFDEVFAQTTLFFIRDLVNCINSDIPVHKSTYDEPVDFLDGNGFKVEGNDKYGYTITRLNT